MFLTCIFSYCIDGSLRSQSLEQHRLPVFSGVVLTVSGIDDVERRTDINRLLTQQEGTYVKNLERPVRVTHLLCSGDVETDKMRYAKKFNTKGEAAIHLVWEEWFWDSLRFGGQSDLRPSSHPSLSSSIFRSISSIFGICNFSVGALVTTAHLRQI